MWPSRTCFILSSLIVLLACCSGTTDVPSTPVGKLKILGIFGHLGKSHFDVFKPLLEELARRGHDLTVISYFPRTEKAIAEEPLPNYKDIKLTAENYGVFVNVVDLKLIDHSFVRIFKELYMLRFMASVACEAGLKSPEVKALIDSGQKFDLVMTENFNTNCFMALVHRLNAPFLEITTHQLMPWAVDQLAISNAGSYIPAMFAHVPRPMSFLERTWNMAVVWIATTAFDTVFHWKDQAIAEETYGPRLPDVKEISKGMSLMMVNTHYSLHGARPYPPNVIEVGGLHIPRKSNPLPDDIAEFLDNAHEGVLYFNLGSMVKMSSVPEEKLQVLLSVLGSLPRKVIWKWETEELPHKPSNVLVKKWLPQFDILAHPNVKCYFGHGGLLGLSEGVFNGVPMILMPLYGDQYTNAIAAQARGAALLLEYEHLNERTLRHALDELFNNTSYMDNARKLSKAYRDRPFTPVETAVWWTEYAARADNLPYLRSEATKMPWWQRELADVTVFLLAALALALYAVYSGVSHLLSRQKRRRGSYKRTTNKKRN